MIIRNIWGVGRNYAKHAQELANPIPQSPMIFLKAGSCATVNSPDHELPFWVEEVHHEVELALKIGQNYKVIEGAVALDLTERRLQNMAKKEGLPWTKAKSFPNACAVSSFFTLKNMEEVADAQISLWVNDELKQNANLNEMIFKLPELVDHILTYYPVCPGDLILTGTPAGVGPIQAGDRLKAQITGHITHIWKISQEKPPAPPPEKQ